MKTEMKLYGLPMTKKEKINNIIDLTLKNVIDKGNVEGLENDRCCEIDWYEEGILRNYTAMIKRELDGLL